MDFSLSVADIADIERTTRSQAKNLDWFKYRIGRITGCVVGGVMKMRTFTSNIDVLKKICHPNSNLTTPALRYGRVHEKDGVALYLRSFESHTNFKVNS